MSASSFDTAFVFAETTRPAAGSATCEFADICGHERSSACAGRTSGLVPVDGDHWVTPSCLTEAVPPHQDLHQDIHLDIHHDKKETPA